MKNKLYLLTLILLIGVFTHCGTESTPIYTLTTSVNGEGTITPSSGEFEEGVTVTLTSTPSEHWVFSNWSGDGSGTSNTLTITMDMDKSVVGNFERRDYPLTITIEGEGEVEQEVVQSKTTDYPFETVVQLTSKPKDGWSFVGWSGDIESTEAVIEVTIKNDLRITVLFEPIYYDINLSTKCYGSISKELISGEKLNGKYRYDSKLLLESTPLSSMFEFIKWQDYSDDIENVIEIIVKQDISLKAIFKAKTDFAFIEPSNAFVIGNLVYNGGFRITNKLDHNITLLSAKAYRSNKSYIGAWNIDNTEIKINKNNRYTIDFSFSKPTVEELAEYIVEFEFLYKDVACSDTRRFSGERTSL